MSGVFDMQGRSSRPIRGASSPIAPGVSVPSSGILVLLIVGMSFFWQFLRDANCMALFVPCTLFGSTLSSRTLTLTFYALAAVVACFLAVFPRVCASLARPTPIASCGVLATVLGVSAHAVRTFGTSDGIVLAVAQLVEVCVLALLFASLTSFWATASSRLMGLADRYATWGILGSALASLVFSFALFALVPLKALFPLVVPLVASLLAAAYGYRFLGLAHGNVKPPLTYRGGGSPAEGRADCASRTPEVVPGTDGARRSFRSVFRRPSPARALFAVLVGVLFLSTCAKGMYDGLIADDIETSMQLKHFITIAELAVIMLVCMCAAGVERLAFLGWAVLTGGLVTGLAFMSFTGSPTLMQVGLGTVAAARTCCEAFVFILVASRGMGRATLDVHATPAPFCSLQVSRLALRAFAVPELAACLVGYGLLPAVLGAASSTGAGSLVGLVSIGLGIAVVACAFLLMASFALRGLDGSSDREELVARNNGPSKDGNVVLSSSETASGPSELTDTHAVVESAVRPTGIVGGYGDIAECIGKLAERCGLTPREREIAAYVFRGYSAKRIAEIDCVSLNTVQTHTRNVYRKLCVHSRQELIDLVEGSRGLDR